MEPLIIVGLGAAGLSLASGDKQIDSRPTGPSNDRDVGASAAPFRNGEALPLTDVQRVTRARYLVGMAERKELDEFVTRDEGVLGRYGYSASSSKVLDLYYQLTPHNGGRNPRAPDCATRWSKQGSDFVNRTSDCVGGAAWCMGFDRYQPNRTTVQGGWLNTDGMLSAMARGECFVETDPYPGCLVVSSSAVVGESRTLGHVGVVMSVPRAFQRASKESWSGLQVANIAAYNGPANRVTTGAGWYAAAQLRDSAGRRRATFLRSTMKD